VVPPTWEDDVTELREPGFSLDLPGDWMQVESGEPGGLKYVEAGGTGVVTVMLLGVRPVYAIADSRRLLEDYLKHRSTFEKGQAPALEQSDPRSSQIGDEVEGEWHAVDAQSGTRLRHRVLLENSVLVDACYEAPDPDDAAFDAVADAILGSLQVSVE
jgi:hypothetical protein